MPADTKYVCQCRELTKCKKLDEKCTESRLDCLRHLYKPRWLAPVVYSATVYFRLFAVSIAKIAASQ